MTATNLTPVTWLPPIEVKDHMGNPLPADREFFAPPPAQVGPVVSAWSTLRASAAASSGALKMFIMLISGGAAAGAVYLLVDRDVIRLRGNEQLVVAAISAAVVALIVAVTFKWRHQCNYIGENGVAIYATSAWRGGRSIGKSQILTFNNAAALTTHQVRHYHNGVYTGTNFNFSWFDQTGRRMFVISGSHHSKKGKPKPNSKFNLAVAAELAWSRHYLARAIQELEQTGFATFAAKGNHFVRIGPGVIEFHFKGDPVQMHRADIRDVKLASGTMTFYHNDAKWFSSRGKYSLEYGQLTNARVFLLMLDKLMGYRFA
jgi:hypothetical protein